MPEQIGRREHRRAGAWVQLLADLRAPSAVITEEVLARTYAGRQTPYGWLARAVSSRAHRVLDVGCGTGPMSRELAASGRMVVGLDIWRPALLKAATMSPGPWVQADATRLPFADESLDAVTTAMGMAVISPVPEFLAEVARVLKPGGVFASITITARPLRRTDLAVLARLTQLLRASPRLPSSLELIATRMLDAAGLTRAEDRRERYAYQVLGPAEAQRVIETYYPASVDPERLPAAIDYLTGRNTGRPVTVPIPIRRIVAIK